MSKIALDLSKLDPIVEPIVRAHGGEIAELEWTSEPGGWVLRVLVEKQGSAAGKFSTEDAAVSLELCSNVARELSPALDVSEMVGHRYSLEVSSPGIERPLRREAHYDRFQGKLVKVKFRNPMPAASAPSSGTQASGTAKAAAAKAERVVTGTLEAGDAAGAWRVTDGSRSFPFSLDDVAEARLVFEFGAKKSARRASPRASKKTA
jgi:ribosome maturation factor RimP